MQRLNELENKDIREGMGLAYVLRGTQPSYWVITRLVYDKRYDEYLIYLKTLSGDTTHSIGYAVHPRYAHSAWHVFDIP